MTGMDLKRQENGLSEYTFVESNDTINYCTKCVSK